MCDRQRLLKQIRMYHFALVDVGLYLDGHPNCPKALAYYQKYRKLYLEAVAAYESQFGPLTMMANDDPDRWTWSDDPWPWEMEA